jgi:hypothetical protein
MLGPVRYARSIFPPAILVLIVSLDADTAEKNAIVFGHTRIATESRNEPFHKYLKFIDEAVAQAADSGSASPKNPKEPASKADSTTSKTQTPAAGKTRSSKAPAPTKSIPSVDKPQEENKLPEKSPSILQMLEGHETELMVAAAFAAAFFFIGWICGGNYYLRRDRRRRTKIRF